MTTSTGSTADLVENVLNSMREAASSGSTAAIDALRAQSSKEGEAVSPAEKKPEPKDALKTANRVVIRPNGEEYHVRKLGEHDDVAAMQRAREKNINVLAYGPPGTGKTALIEAAYCDGIVYTVQGTGDTETGDFVGGFVQLPGGEFLWVDGPLIRAMDEGRPLYIDEIALIDPKVLALVYGVMDGRDEIRITQNPERGVVKAKTGFYVVAACNPNAPGARMSEALLSRFDLQFEITTDYALAKRMGVDAKVVQVAQNLDRKRISSEISWSPQLRELLSYKRIAEQFGDTVALRNLISTAPENDRVVVTDVVSRTMTKSYTKLTVD
jgi:nitric oxide reductase NorQ protein